MHEGRDMRKGMAKVAVYPLLIVNVGLLLLWLAPSRVLLNLFISWLYRDGHLTDGQSAQIPFILRSFDGLFALLAGLSILVLFALLDMHYTRGAGQGLLLRRFLRVMGIQLLSLGLVQLVFWWAVSQSLTAAFDSWLVLLELIAGAALVVVTTFDSRRQAREQENGY